MPTTGKADLIAASLTDGGADKFAIHTVGLGAGHVDIPVNNADISSFGH